MKKTLLQTVFYTSLGLASLMAGAALAEPAPAQTYPTSSYPSGIYPPSNDAAEWVGPYAGIHGGYEWGDLNNKGGVAGPNGSQSSWLGGGQVGNNWQFTNHLVVGVEGDASALGVHTRNASSTFNENWMATFRGRAGYAMNRTMPYITAGVGVTDTDFKTPGQGSTSDAQAGTAVGGGMDFKLIGPDNAPSHWAGRVEYLYVDVPKDNTTIGSTPVSGGSGNNIVRVGLNYMF